MVGTGNIGLAAIRIFKGFGTRVIAHDPYGKPELAEELGFEYVSLDELLGSFAPEPEPERDAAPAQTAKSVEPEAVDYGKFERPTVIRNRRDLDDHLSNPRSDYLDIPAFLRRQAD